MKRLLWSSNSPRVGSGYGAQTALITPRLRDAGYDVAIHAQFGHQEYVDTWEGLTLYPRASDEHGIGTLKPHAVLHQADAVITHYDAWVYDPKEIGAPWIPWFPVDSEPVTSFILDKIQRAAYRITQTRHGQASVEERKLQCAYVPAAYDSTIYHPGASDWRERAGKTADQFIVAVVARNTGRAGGPSRKAFPQLLEGFKLFLDVRPDAFLYLHTLTNGQVDIDREIQRLGIPDENVSQCLPLELLSGLCSPQHMAEMYRAADVLLSPSMGEGFGVPIVEAQACGTPVITGDWTAMSEVTRSGIAIPKENSIRWPEPSGADWRLVQPEAVAAALQAVAETTYDPAEVSASVADYEVETVLRDHWLPVLEEASAAVKPRPVSVAPNRAQRRDKKKKRGSSPAESMPPAYLETLASNGDGRRAVLSFGIGTHAELLDIALPSYQAFAERHGYDMLRGTLAAPCDRPPSWWKVPMLHAALDTYAEVVFLGADLIITDPEDDFDVPADAWQALVPHRNKYGEIPNADVWVLRPQMRSVLAGMWERTRYIDHGWWEQAALLSMMGYKFDPLPSVPARPSSLRDEHTHWLDGGWNVHAWCPQPERPRIMHATMYEDRAGVMRAWAAGLKVESVAEAV